MNKELDEILDGLHKINRLQIDNDTLSFTTELDNHIWNLSPIDIGTIIYILQVKRDDLYEENRYLKNRIEDLEDTIKTSRKTSDITNDLANDYKKRIDKTAEFLEQFMPNYSLDHSDIQKAIDMLRGGENE